jgi:hypothetical protein
VGIGARLARAGTWLVGVFGSYTLAVTLLLLLLVLTAVGTFAQAHMSLYDVQRRYFDSLFAVVDVGPVSVPLPGGALTIALLSINLVVGGVLRLRRGASTAGILVTHLGMLVLFAGGLVETLASDKGQMTLHEPARGGTADALSESDRFSSYYEWELAVAERKADGTLTEHVVPWSRLEGLGARALRAASKDLPFEVLVTGWSPNGRPRRAVGPGQGVNGWVIEALEREMEAERNVPAAVVTLARAGTGHGPRAIVWGRQAFPWATTVDGRTFEVDLRHRSWPLPFRVRLNRFVHEMHPGTRMDSRFSSYVTKIEGGLERDVHITMNEPLRHRGYTFYQSGWGPPDAPPGTPRYSTFSVVRNPSDRVPILACFVIAVGLVLHFGRRLLRHIRSESQRVPVRGTAT